ncbi:MAG: tRNA (guanosine(37)-N1)-methyltransferase TrmD [Peptostreptococcaceae bacterium]|nr:tRNA (guanosine(37)-N1)-methyltransferase TrmD [Peptostreptococcaceae bacterium]
MKYHIMTLFPELIDAATQFSIIKRAKEAEKIAINSYNIRDYSTNKHKKVDDYPFGGGAGMVMGPQPIVDCHRHIVSTLRGSKRTIYLSPKGKVFNQQMAHDLLQYDNLILLCGHYEGIDQRAIDLIVDEEISIGDYVLTGGEIPAIVLVEATARLVEDVLAKPESYQDESFSNNLLEYPQYTRPRDFEGMQVPEVLLNGNHKEIDDWRFEQSIRATLQRRAELIDEQSFDKNQAKIYQKVLRENE